VAHLRASAGIQPFEKGIRWMEARQVVQEPVRFPHDLYALEIALKKIYRTSRQFLVPDIHGFLFVLGREGKSGENFAAVAIPVDHGGVHEAVTTIPAGNFAYYYHKGPYETLDRSHSKLKTYIKKAGHRISGPVMERGLISGLGAFSQRDYLVEIQAPVVPC